MKIGLIGCGKQAVKHIAGLQRCPDVAVVAADKEVSLARGLAERTGVAWVENADRIFTDPEVDAVVLCVPTPFHAPLIRRALAQGKDFFCEKPLCETAEEARELDALVRCARRIGMVGYVYRQAPVFQKARTILADAGKTGHSAVLGKLSLAFLRIGGRGSAAAWKHSRRDGGGALNEMLVHMLDLAVWCFGPIARAELLINEVFRPERVIADRLVQADAEDYVLARCTTQCGLPVVIQADLITPAFCQFLEVQGDNGTLMVSIQSEMPQFVFAITATDGYPGGRTDLRYEQPNLFEAQMASFVAALRDRNPAVSATLTDSVNVAETLEMLKCGAHRTSAR